MAMISMFSTLGPVTVNSMMVTGIQFGDVEAPEGWMVKWTKRHEVKERTLHSSCKDQMELFLL